MKNTRKWILSSFCLPKDGQKIYYFCDTLGIFRGEFHIDKSSIGNPNKFSSNHGVVDADDIQYWMPYDHSLRDMIPLPPNYNLIDINSSQSMISSDLDIYLSDRYSQLYNYQEIDLPLSQQQFTFTYELTKGIKQYE